MFQLPLELWFSSILKQNLVSFQMAQNCISNGLFIYILKDNFKLNNQPIFALKIPKEALRTSLG